MRKTQFIFISFLFISLNLSAQCYNKIGDLSGIESSNNSLLEQAACVLRDSFPLEFRPYFKVYDFGFYIQNGTMDGYEAYINQAKTLITSQYYLLFLRKSSPNGIYEEILVDFKFPTGEGKFSCIMEADIQNFRLYLPAFLANEYSKLGEIYTNADLAILKTINKYTEFVTEKSGCCITGFRSPSCSNCMTAKQASVVLDNLGFSSHNVDKVSTVSTSYSVTHDGKFKQFAKFKVSTDLTEFDSEALVDNFYTIAGKYYTPILAETHYVNEADCLNIIDEAIKSSEDYFIKILVFLIKDASFQELKVKILYGSPKGSTKSIRIINVNNTSDFTLSEVASKLEDFIALCGASAPVCIDAPVNINSVSKDDIYIWIGPTRSKLCSITGSFADINQLEEPDISQFCFQKTKKEKESLPEKSRLWESIQPSGVIDVSSINSIKNAILATSEEETVAFLCLHVLGHNSGCLHSDYKDEWGVIIENSCEAGFMRSGAMFEASRAPRYTIGGNNNHFWLTLGDDDNPEIYRWNCPSDYITGRNWIEGDYGKGKDRTYGLQHLDTQEIRRKIREYLSN